MVLHRALNQFQKESIQQVGIKSIRESTLLSCSLISMGSLEEKKGFRLFKCSSHQEKYGSFKN